MHKETAQQKPFVNLALLKHTNPIFHHTPQRLFKETQGYLMVLDPLI